MLEEAIELGRLGFRVFPLHHKDKNPAVTGWIDNASSDADALRILWFTGEQISPKPLNIAVLMGRASGILGLDIDYDDGANREFLYNLPLSVTTKTSKGHHVFYRYPAHWPEIGKLVLAYGLREGKNKACVTIRGNGHYFVAPPSIHPETGLEYVFEKYTGWDENYKGPKCDLLSPEEVPFATAPDWLIAAIEAQEPRRSGDKYEENTRHGMFVATATAMRKDGKSEDEIVTRLIERNLQDCVPPKENCERELRNIAKWCMVSVQPTPLEEKLKQREEKRRYLMPLGYDHSDYFYLSKSNRQIVKLSPAGHTANGLLHVMSEEYWRAMYPGKKGSINWQRAASDMMEACRKKGIFSVERVRGSGAWSDNGRLILHLGTSLLCDGSPCDLFELDTRNTYELSSTYPAPPAEESTAAENQLFLTACEAASWKQPGSAKLFAGALTLLRIGGALPWRPHLWLTGPAGSGKTTLFTTLVKTMAGDHAVYFQGSTTEAGIRQELLSDSRPVVFDEAETNDKRSGGRMKHILELARQASSESDARIVKGTPDGKGLRFKINSPFVLASIRVNLPEEADQTRFTVVRLDRPKSEQPEPFFHAIEAITPRVADAIYARAAKRFKTVLKNYEILKKEIALRSSHRHGQQHGMLLAGYAILKYEDVITPHQAMTLIEEAHVLDQGVERDSDADEHGCLEFLMDLKLRIKMSNTDHAEEMPLQRVIEIAKHNNEVSCRLQEYGLNVHGKDLFVSTTHSFLAQAFRDQKWQEWGEPLSRLPGAEKDRAYFLKVRRRAVRIPLKLLTSVDVPSSSTPEPF